MKRIWIIVGMMVVAGGAYAANPETRDVATSLKYVDYQLSERQDMVPATTGDKAITPTGTKGTIGEREIKTTLGDEATNQNDAGLTTVGTVNTALTTKQSKIIKEPTVNIVTRSGSSDDNSITTTPIYDSVKNTYGNGLVRAETLNTAVANAVDDALTQVDAGWMLGTLGTVLPTTMYAQPSDTPTSYCYKRVQTDSSHTDAQNSCSTAVYSDFVKGDWAVVMPKETGITYNGTCTGASCNKEVRGISACINHTFTGYGYAVMAPDSLSSELESAYVAGQSGATPSGPYCYCKATNPHIGAATAVSPWVFYLTASSAGNCALSCAAYCARNVRYYARFRGAVFGGVTVEP